MRVAPRLPLVVLAGALLLAPQPVRTLSLTILRWPFAVLSDGVRLLVTLPRLPSLTQENARLRAELTRQGLEAAQLREALRHRDQAAVLLALPAAKAGMVASILGYSPWPTQRTLLLDRGARQGLRAGTAVLDAGGVVGRVLEAQPTTALVLLLTDPESRVAGIVERTRETGLLVGTSGGLCEFTYLDVDTDLKSGDRVLTAGLGGVFPKGLPLGTVVRVVKDTVSGSAWASIKPAAHLEQLEEVLCLPAPARLASPSEAAGAQAGLSRPAPAGS